MKKLILTMTWMLAAFLTQASENVEKENGKQLEHQKEEVTVGMVKSNNSLSILDCSVTLKGKVDLGPIEAEITCTVTDPSCEKARLLLQPV
jgi:methenyltetrahydromethanopterin cyclohydrolase